VSDLRFLALDHPFTLSAPEPLRSVFAHALEPLSVDSGTSVPPRECGHITVAEATDGRWTFTSERAEPSPMALGSLVARVLEYVNQRAAASLTFEVPLHAAGVRTAGGGVIALAGSSGAGKSTLGAAAMLAGWGFLAEEIAAVDPVSLAVRPYHRPIGLRRGGAGALGIEYPEFDDGRYSDVYPWPVPTDRRAHDGTLLGIALVHRNDTDVAITEVGQARALAELVEHTVVPDDERVAAVFGLLDSLVRRVPIVRLAYDTPADGVGLLDELASRWES
jgi:hypothetical protein